MAEARGTYVQLSIYNQMILDAVDLKDGAIAARDAEIARLREALGNVSRMKLFPDDKINRTTLSAAIGIARAALDAPQSIEGK